MTISKFSGEYHFLSNFSGVPHTVFGYRTVEHYFQAMKTFDEAQRQLIKRAATAAEAKSLGRKCTMRPDWQQVKQSVMLEALREKFKPGTTCAQALLATGNEALIEGNTWHDMIWGQCTCSLHVTKPGLNLLGKLLEQVRKELLT